MDSLSDVRPTTSLFGFVTEVANAAQGRSNLDGALERCKLELGRSVARMNGGTELVTTYLAQLGRDKVYDLVHLRAAID